MFSLQAAAMQTHSVFGRSESGEKNPPQVRPEKDLSSTVQEDKVSLGNKVVNYLGSAEGQRGLQYSATFLASGAGAYLGYPGVLISAGAGILKGIAESAIEDYHDPAVKSACITAHAIMLTVPALAGLGLSGMLTPYIGAPAARLVGTAVGAIGTGKMFNDFRNLEGLPGFRPPEPWEK